MRLVLTALPLVLVACGPSQQDIDNIAIVTCNIMGESRNMDAAMRIKEINAAREKIGAEPYLRTDETIKTSFEYGLCEELVKSDSLYDQKLRSVMEVTRSIRDRENKLAEAAAREKEAARDERIEEFVASVGGGFTATDSGLRYKFTVRGNGSLPSITDSVEVHYEGKLLDGTVFDSSYSRGQTVTFGITQVIPGWTEALQLMPKGSDAQIIVPSELAYGDTGAGAVIGPNEDLYFRVELIDIKD